NRAAQAESPSRRWTKDLPARSSRRVTTQATCTRARARAEAGARQSWSRDCARGSRPEVEIGDGPRERIANEFPAEDVLRARQGDGAREYPARAHVSLRSTPRASASEASACALAVPGSRAPHVRSAGRSSGLAERLLRLEHGQRR